ncbi:MAG: class I SAM-dependent methyltransferase [Caldilineales bacterium]|nr:class I SAM-dependent methyltransferase [Caldilineales bacterium]MDW8318405.1 class I SAM-dependent methyltransferase [Anaerolineae bacterium]
MMQTYGTGFARAYNLRWSGFARQVAPLILDFYAATPVGRQNQTVLDLCCGTGQLAVHFLERGYRVVGLDLSEAMLELARENARPYIEAGRAAFVQGDAADFTLGERFGLVVSTFDSLNHLEDEGVLRRCFQCVYAVSEGYFIFDLNTRRGLRRWNSIYVDDTDDEAFIVTRGIYDGHSDKAWTRINGFLRLPDGLYERFEETVFNTVFEMAQVRALLHDVGWRDVYFAQAHDLRTPLEDPEAVGRVFVVARR